MSPPWPHLTCLHSCTPNYAVNSPLVTGIWLSEYGAYAVTRRLLMATTLITAKASRSAAASVAPMTMPASAPVLRPELDACGQTYHGSLKVRAVVDKKRIWGSYCDWRLLLAPKGSEPVAPSQ